MTSYIEAWYELFDAASITTGTFAERQFQWLAAQGITSGSLDERWIKYLAAQGFSTGTLNERWLAFMADSGHSTGTFNERQIGWLTNSFTGILDELSVAPVAAHSDRRLTRASWGTDDGVLDPMRRVWRLSDSAEMNFSYDPETNRFDWAAVVTWLGGSTGRIIKWFDQTGNGNYWEQSTPTAAPFFVENVGLDFRLASGTSMLMSTAGLTTDWGFEAFARSTLAAGTTGQTLLSLSDPASTAEYAAALFANLSTSLKADAASRSGGVSSVSSLTSAFTAGVEAVFSMQMPSAASRTVRANGVAGTANTETRAFPASSRWKLGRLFDSGVSQLLLDEPVSETFIFNAAASAADRLALEAAW